jgi:hypothetical protein
VLKTECRNCSPKVSLNREDSFLRLQGEIVRYQPNIFFFVRKKNKTK